MTDDQKNLLSSKDQIKHWLEESSHMLKQIKDMLESNSSKSERKQSLEEKKEMKNLSLNSKQEVITKEVIIYKEVIKESTTSLELFSLLSWFNSMVQSNQFLDDEVLQQWCHSNRLPCHII